jgi:hypothetical protein
MKTYGSNYNGAQLWARVYLQHGPLHANASNIGGLAQAVLCVEAEALGVPLEQWRMDYNQNGIYFECRPGENTQDLENQLTAMGFKRSKSAA